MTIEQSSLCKLQQREQVPCYIGFGQKIKIAFFEEPFSANIATVVLQYFQLDLLFPGFTSSKSLTDAFFFHPAFLFRSINAEVYSYFIAIFLAKVQMSAR